MERETSHSCTGGLTEVVGVGDELLEGKGGRVLPVAVVKIVSPWAKCWGPELQAVCWKPQRGVTGNQICVCFWQHKRETLKMTKYVELVIVADNREVRTFSNFSVQLVKVNK